MAMTNKERAVVQQLQQELAIVSALRFTPLVAYDIPCPEPGSYYSRDNPVRGWKVWNCNFEARAERYCSTSVGHWSEGSSGGSQNGIAMHTLKSNALKMARNHMEREAARGLAKLDRAIECALEEEGNSK